MTAAKKITILRAGERRRSFILPKPPWPRIGETVTLEDRNYLVVAIEPVEVLLTLIATGTNPRRLTCGGERL